MTAHVDISSLTFSWGRRVPLVRQAEAMECGHACLAMIAAYHGNRMGLQELRRRFPPSGQGSSLKDLSDIATELGMTARPLRADLGAVPHLERPCILHWDLDHFVVLKSIGRRRAIVHDPARGVLKLGPEEFSRHYTGIALELSPAPGFEKSRRPARLRLSDLWSRIVGLKRCLVQLLALSLLLQLFSIAAPFYMQTVVDDVVLRGDTGLLLTLAIGFLLLLVVETGTNALRASVILHLSTRLHLQLAANLFQHLVRLPMTWFQRRHLGDVLSRFSSLDAVREILSTGLVTALVDGLMALIMLLIMFLYDARLTLIVVGILALYILLRLLLFPPLRRLSQESIANHALCETSFMETARGMQTVKLLQRENERQGQWHNRMADAMNSDIRVAKMGIGFAAANRLLFGIENVLVVYFAAHAVMENVISLGMLFAFMSYKQRFTGAIDSLVDQLIELLMLGLHLERISDIALANKEPGGIVLPESVRGKEAGGLRITSKRLSFRYGAQEPWIFQGVELSVPAGSSIALVGPSGCGKTSLLKCLMGLMPATEGELSINGVPITSRQDYRSLIAGVMQSDQLLGGSIADNIACFDQQLDWERVMHSAQLACAHEAIMQMPMQYNTPVGDMGSTLSGGQVQRIMLARALYRQPRVLFLDEATSHLDVETERAINANIAGMNMTRIMVAHRPDTIAMADQVYELRRDCRKTQVR